ncbi:MAG: SUMF1/EgtB/PvdO family nonheme iron enzyme [Paracoccaceae bacterium]
MAAVVAVGSGFLLRPGAPFPQPQTVVMVESTQHYRPAGEFRQGTHVVDAPLEPLEIDAFRIMKFHVSEADYARCVSDDACLPAFGQGRPDIAQTGVNHADATAYAAWLSDRSGLDWRLPTDAEWLRAAGSRGFDDGFAPEANGADPSRRWIAGYRREVERRGEADLDLHPFGHFGVNDTGVADIAGNIWEWTQTCFKNGTVSADSAVILTQSEYCGVRAVQGKHRGFVIDFVRDARTGGCAAGVPPDYLGFRLVRPAP